ncbi:hypothetical protein A0H81_13990 [Grifola frondosa]|uniref:Uncharacterized protein n=1 Tax=Grifola frondosa TaxID=5627 RepID=A0A1C7LMM7_GRIFR|nr:hypothetical protein A0H81_13990 [Grifola frondosa]
MLTTLRYHKTPVVIYRTSRNHVVPGALRLARNSYFRCLDSTMSRTAMYRHFWPVQIVSVPNCSCILAKSHRLCYRCAYRASLLPKDSELDARLFTNHQSGSKSLSDIFPSPAPVAGSTATDVKAIWNTDKTILLDILRCKYNVGISRFKHFWPKAQYTRS